MEQNEEQPKRSLDYSNWKQHYAMLNQANREDPMDAIMNLATLDNLFAVRQDLWCLMVDVMSSDTTLTDGPDTIGDRIFFFQNLQTLWELVYRIRELVIDKKLVYQYLLQ